MPIYEYECTACNHQFEKLQKVSDDAPPCPKCGSAEIRKRVSRTTFQLKGTGWYVTDYKKTPGSMASSGSSDAPKPGAKADDSTASESKETKTEATPSSDSKPKAASTNKDASAA